MSDDMSVDACRCGQRRKLVAFDLCHPCYMAIRRARQRYLIKGSITSYQAGVLKKMGRPSRAMREAMPWLVELRDEAPVGGQARLPRRQARGRIAYHMRAKEPMTWRSIAEHIGYTDQRTAIKAARTYAQRENLCWPPTKEATHD